MRLTWKDAAATILVAAIVIPYVGYLVRGEMPFIKDPRGMAGTALILGIAACAVGASAAQGSSILVKIGNVLGPVALVLGIATLIFETEWLLAGTIGAIVLLWLLATARHAVSGPVRTTTPPEAAALTR